MLLKYECEQQPNRASRVTLDGDRATRSACRCRKLDWSPTEADKESVIRTTELIGQAVGAADLGRLEFEEGRDERYWNMTTSWHQLGITRMAEGPRDGVVDPDCLVHGDAQPLRGGGQRDADRRTGQPDTDDHRAGDPARRPSQGGTGGLRR